MRLVCALVLCVLAGCGQKSFQESDAIYKDEVAKLERLSEELRKASESAGSEAEKNQVFKKYDRLLAEQEARVKEAERVKESAK